MHKVLSVHRGYYAWPDEREDFVETAPVQQVHSPRAQDIWQILLECVSMSMEVGSTDGDWHLHIWIADE